MLMLIPFLLPTPANAGEMDGWVTVNYLRNEDGGETYSSSEQRARINWNTALSNADILNLYFQFSRQEQDNPDGEEFRPLAGFTLAGPEYRLLMEYREFIDRNLEDNGFTLTTKTFFTTFTADYGPEYPNLTLDFSRTESKDDLDEPETDFVEADFGLRTAYQNGPWSVRYSHRKNTFNNNLSTLVPIRLDEPVGIAVDAAGTIYVTDTAGNRVLRFSPSGAFLSDFGRSGSGDGQFRGPKGIAVSESFIYVVDSGNDRVEQFDLTGTFISEWGIFGSGPGDFNDPYGIAVDPTGVYVTDRNNDRVQKFTPGGGLLFSIRGFNSPSGITSNGNLVFVADTLNHRIQVFTTEGTFITQWGTFGSSIGQFQFPTDVAVDSADRVYVTDRDNNRIQVFTTTGAFLNSFGTAGAEPGQFQRPEGIAVTPGDDLAIADTGNNRIQVLTSSGVFRFEIGEVSGAERGRSTETSLDSFNVIYSRELVRGVYATLDYDLLLSDEEDKDTGERLVSTENHDINAELRLLPYRWISFTSLYDLRFFDTTSGDADTERDELTQTYILALQLMPKLHVSSSYTRDDVETNVGPDEGSAFTTFNVNMSPTNRINVNLSYSNLQNQEDGKDTLETDTFTAFTDMILYRGIDLNLLYSISNTQDFESDGEIDTQRVRSLLRLVPRPNMTMNTTAEYTISKSSFADTPDVSTNTILASTDFTWAISRRLNLYVDADYIRSDSAGVVSDQINYTSDLVWRMNRYLTFFLGLRGGTEEEDVRNFRTQAKFPFWWDTRATVNFEIESGGETDRRFLFVELAKFF